MTKAALEAKNTAMDGAVSGYADALLSYRKLLPTLYSQDAPGFEMPDLVLEDPKNPTGNSNYKRIAKALITDGKARVQGKDGRFIDITLDDTDPESLDARDSKNGGVFKKAIGVDNLNSLGSGARANNFSDAVENAVEKNSSDIGFLKGASIGNALSGFARWASNVGWMKAIGTLIMSLFSGKGIPQELQQSIAQVTAENIRSDLTENLKGQGYTPDEIKTASDRAYYATLEKAGFADPSAPKVSSDPRAIAAVTLDDAKVKETRNEVYRAVMHPRNEDSLGEKIGKEFVKKKNDSGFLSRNLAWVRGVSNEGLMKSGERVAETIATSIADFTTNPDQAQQLARMDRNTYASTVADNTIAALRKDEKKFALPKKLTEEQFAEFRQRIHEAVRQDYNQIHMASSLAATNVRMPMDSRVAAAAQGARDAGMTGGLDATEAGAGNVPKAVANAKGKNNKPGMGSKGIPAAPATDLEVS